MRQYCTYNRQSISVGSLYNKEQYNGSQIFLLAMILQLVLSRIIPPPDNGISSNLCRAHNQK